jgi:polyferredoxin
LSPDQNTLRIDGVGAAPTRAEQMWLSRPVYETLPFYYMALGLIALLAGLYVNYWYWPVICIFVGLGSLVAGLIVWLKRRDYRSNRADLDQPNRL